MQPSRYRIAIASLFVALFAVGSANLPTKAAPGQWDIRHYTTGDSSELVTFVPITVSSGGAYRAIYCLDLGDAPAGGEILTVDAHAQVTIPHWDTIAVSTQLFLADSCQSLGGTEIGEAQGTNLDRPTHHLNIQRGGSITVEQWNERRYIVLLCWSASTTAKPGDRLLVDQDYGRLSAVRFTPGG